MIARNLCLTAALLALGCQDKTPAPAATAAPHPTAAATTTAATTTAATTAPTSAAPQAPAKKYDCGSKEKPCPMQAWMKKNMAPASAAEDAPALAKALGYVADHPPAGFTEWTSMATAAANKARAGDVNGAKASCKPCHDKYKEPYRATMRDQPF